MKKSLVALAALAVVGAASAQSSVTLFGVADANYQNARQAGATVNRLVGSGSTNSSRLGFRGVEDLGGGLSGSFWFEAGVNVDNGTGGGTTLNNQAAAAGTGNAGLVFNRRSTVSLTSASIGELRIGRDYTPTFWNLTIYDPFGTVGAGAATNMAQGTNTSSAGVQTAVRASNTIGYFLPPNLGGVYGQLMYAFGENASNAAGGTSKDGNYVGFRLGYANGPLDLALAYGTTKLASGDVTAVNAGVSYNFGVATVMGQLFNDRKNSTLVAGTAAFNRSNGWLLGANIPVGSGTIPVSISGIKDNNAQASGANKAQQFAIGYVYNLSKRTALYTTYSLISNKNLSATSGGGTTGVAGANWTGLDLGLRHSF
jgi:predicted porin